MHYAAVLRKGYKELMFIPVRTKVLKAALQLGYQDIQWLFFRTCVVITRKDFKINM